MVGLLLRSPGAGHAARHGSRIGKEAVDLCKERGGKSWRLAFDALVENVTLGKSGTSRTLVILSGKEDCGKRSGSCKTTYRITPKNVTKVR